MRLLQITDTHLFASAEGGCWPTHGVESGRRAGAGAGQRAPVRSSSPPGISPRITARNPHQRFASMMAPWLAPSTGCPATTTTAPDDRIPPCGRHQRGQAAGGDHWQVILLDTQVRGNPRGARGSPAGGPDQALRQGHPERHALIALHHQAVPVGCAWLDQHNLECRRPVRRAGPPPAAEDHPVRPRPSGV